MQKLDTFDAHTEALRFGDKKARRASKVPNEFVGRTKRSGRRQSKRAFRWTRGPHHTKWSPRAELRGETTFAPYSDG